MIGSRRGPGSPDYAHPAWTKRELAADRVARGLYRYL
jgi:hypothetical protein